MRKGKIMRIRKQALGDRNIVGARITQMFAREEENETLLNAMERAGLKAPSRCKSGSCGFCHSRLISGEYHVNKEHEYRRQADLKFGYIHPCCTYPESDMEIDVPPFLGGELI